MAPVAKSTTAPGQNNRMSAIRAPARTCLVGSPAAGFVLWHCETDPPNTVAQLDNVDAITIIPNTFKTFFLILIDLSILIIVLQFDYSRL